MERIKEPVVLWRPVLFLRSRPAATPKGDQAVEKANGGDEILCFGDSHTMFWSGHDGLFTDKRTLRGLHILHAGPVTAHNILNDDSSVKGKAAFVDHMEERGARYGAVLLCMGEIDCRVHIIRAAVQAGAPIEGFVTETVERYAQFIRFIRERYGLPVVAFGPGPSGDISRQDPQYPCYGGIIERNYAVTVFNELLERRCRAMDGVAHLTIIDRLIDADGVTVKGALYDGCHVSRVYLPAAATALKQRLADLGRPDLLPAPAPAPASARRRIAAAPVSRDVAVGADYVLSSSSDGVDHGVFPGEPSGDFLFRTGHESNPHILIDLKGTYFLEKLIVHNARGEEQCDVRSLYIECSTDLDVYKRIYNDMKLDFTDANPLEIAPPPKKFAVRYIRIGLNEAGSLRLRAVRVIAPTFDQGAAE
jgi:hypothetical protein